MSNPGFTDPFSPPEVATRMKSVGVAKANMPTPQLLVLALIAGAFISFGAMYYTVVMTNPSEHFGAAKMLGGISFSLGFILVVIAGAELFTGNNLIVMAWADGKVSSGQLLRNWGLVYIANMIGAFGTLFLVVMSGYLEGGHHSVGVTAANIAIHKVDHNFTEAFFRGVFCNALVCLASWMCYAARSVTDKILAIIFPVSSFVAMGFEHCIANMFMIPLGIVAVMEPKVVELGGFTAEQMQHLNATGFMGNIVPVTLGNIVGGAGMVALVYYFIYLRGKGEGV